MKLYAQISKIDQQQRLVFGYASTEALDNQGEIVRKEAIEAALPDYMRFANIREMHQPSAVGVAEEAEVDGKGLHLAARIVDDEAWRKVTQGVYKGFSIGGRVTERDAAQKHVITGVELMEISLVDRPANPEAVIELYKAASPRPRIKKGMDTVEDFAAILGDIEKLQAASAAEAAAEGDHSKLPAQLQDWLNQGTALLRAMVAEETSEITSGAYGYSDYGDGDGTSGDMDVSGGKADASWSGKKIAAPRATLAKATCSCGAAKRDGADASLPRQIDALSKRIAVLEAQPLPPKGIAKVVAISKEQDVGGAAYGDSVDGFVARLAEMTPEKRAHELTKLALRFPRPLPR